MTGLVLVTGATGKTGAGLTARLREAGVAHRAASRQGAFPFDWAAPDTWAPALEGVTSVYLIAPPTVDDPYALVLDFIRAALRTAPRRFVFLSMAGLAAGGPAHGQVHQWLKDHSDDWAVLCPSAFMQNFTQGQNLASILEEGRIYSNTGSGRVPFIDAGDIAAAAFAVLTAPAPPNAEFVLTGAETLSYDRVAALIGEACGRPIAHAPVSTDEMAERLIRRGLPETTARFLAFGYATVAAGLADRTTDTVRSLTGAPPTAFADFARKHAAVWRRAP